MTMSRRKRAIDGRCSGWRRNAGADSQGKDRAEPLRSHLLARCKPFARQAHGGCPLVLLIFSSCIALSILLFSGRLFGGSTAAPPNPCLILTALVYPLFKQHRISLSGLSPVPAGQSSFILPSRSSRTPPCQSGRAGPCFDYERDRERSYDYDLAVIGGGSGGYAAARTAAAEGLKTVVLEGGEEVGGLCILRGCMPSKALLYAAEVLHLASHAEPWGIRAEDVGFNFAQVMARKNALIKDFADCRGQQLVSGKFKFLRARARFADPHTLELSTGERLTAAHFVIATGRWLRPRRLPQLEDVGLSDQ